MFSLVSLNCGAVRLQREGEGKGRKRFAEQPLMGMPDCQTTFLLFPSALEVGGAATGLLILACRREKQWGRAETILSQGFSGSPYQFRLILAHDLGDRVSPHTTLLPYIPSFTLWSNRGWRL